MALPWGARLTEDDLAHMPDDGHRYELIDGVLLVTPAPNVAHQRCVVSIVALLHAARPEEHAVLVGPFDVRLSQFTVVQPDVLVARKSDLTDARLEGAPVLAVEIQVAEHPPHRPGHQAADLRSGGCPGVLAGGPRSPQSHRPAPRRRALRRPRHGDR